MSHLHIKAVYSIHISKILYNMNTITTSNTVSMTIIFIKRHDKNILRIRMKVIYGYETKASYLKGMYTFKRLYETDGPGKKKAADIIKTSAACMLSH